MFVRLKPAESKAIKTGTFFLRFNSHFGLGLFVMLGTSNSSYYVSYFVDAVKGYDDDGIVYVDDISLKRALSLNFYELAVREEELQPIYYLDAGFIYNIPDNIPIRTISKKDVQAWYLKSKMLNSLPDIKF